MVLGLIPHNLSPSVSTLVVLATEEDKHGKQSFEDAIKEQIKNLRKQLDSTKPSDGTGQEVDVPGAWRQYAPVPGSMANDLRRVDSRLANQTRIWDAGSAEPRHGMHMPGELPALNGRSAEGRDGRDMRSVAGAAARLGRSFIF